MPAGAPSSGVALARRLALLAWKKAHEAWEARSKGRHGEPAEEQKEKKAAEKLREAEARHKLRDEGKLELEVADERLIFHDDFDHHKAEEGTLQKIKNWFSNWGAMLKEGKMLPAQPRKQPTPRRTFPFPPISPYLPSFHQLYI